MVNGNTVDQIIKITGIVRELVQEFITELTSCNKVPIQDSKLIQEATLTTHQLFLLNCVKANVELDEKD
jgi:hypothetical protein